MADGPVGLNRYLSTDYDLNNEIVAPVPTKSYFLQSEQVFDSRNEKQGKLETRYKRELNCFNFTDRSEFMIIRILNEGSRNSEFKGYPLLKILRSLACELMMSEVELAGFAVYLNRFVWNVNGSLLVVLLYAVGFAVKILFSADLDHVLSHVCAKIPGFVKFLNSWIKRNEDMLMIDVQELNERFRLLTKVPFDDVVVRNEFYVDSILESAPASVYEKKWWQCEMLEASELIIPEPPSMVKLDSIFIDVNLPGLQRGISINSNPSAFNYYFDIEDL